MHGIADREQDFWERLTALVAAWQRVPSDPARFPGPRGR